MRSQGGKESRVRAVEEKKTAAEAVEEEEERGETE